MPIQQAQNLADYQIIEKLAFEIIPDFYADVIPQEHNIFFVEKFQSLSAIQKQLKDGFDYYLILSDDIPVGYIGLQIIADQSLLSLSKLYLLKSSRGKGLGTEAMEFIMEYAQKKIGASNKADCKL